MAAARASPLRALAPILRHPAARSAAQARLFQTSAARLADGVAAPVKKPVGAFRGGIFGFLFGSTLSGAAVYYYILEEYRTSNQLLNNDVFALQAAVQRIEGYTRGMEERVAKVEKK